MNLFTTLGAAAFVCCMFALALNVPAAAIITVGVVCYAMGFCNKKWIERKTAKPLEPIKWLCPHKEKSS